MPELCQELKAYCIWEYAGRVLLLHNSNWKTEPLNIYGIKGIVFLIMTKFILVATLKKHILKHFKINWFWDPVCQYSHGDYFEESADMEYWRLMQNTDTTIHVKKPPRK